MKRSFASGLLTLLVDNSLGPKCPRIMIKRLSIVLALAVIGPLGCYPPHGPETVYNPDPVAKIPAVEQAVARHDLSVAPQLVKDLDNPDPAIRFYSIDALRKLTGQDFGYQYYDPACKRYPAVVKWQKWLAEHGLK
ncbi:MAG TPA: hypothetical protein VHY37_02130 [Tepidisphaeraceae bacterium]|nr:hypothetical protein [Tepidisphaeraceae bacterium]